MSAPPGSQQGHIAATQSQQCHPAATGPARDGARPRRRGARVRGGEDDRGDRADGRAAPPRARRWRRSRSGPDYIDPGYHTLAAGRPGRNLDPVLVGADRIAPLARHGAAGAEVAVVEGVMGLFDGRLADGYGSTAEVAGLLGAPVVLVVDARGQSRSLAALLHGFRSFDPRVDLAGVVLNRVGSARHEEVLRAAAAEVGLPVLGALPRRDALAVPSRHLGLVTAAEHGAAAVAAVDAMAELVAAHVDLDAVTALARPLPHGPAWSPATSCADEGGGDALRARPKAERAGRRGRQAASGAARRAAGSRCGSRCSAALRSPSATPSTSSCSPLRGPRSWSSTRCATAGCRTARPRWCSPAASPRNTSARSRPTSGCGARCGRSPRPARRCTPSAGGCSTCARRSTGRRCATSCPPTRR